ncbi:MAG: TonB-dependent receptor [Croceicoccus sp.]|nr:TonB-dependent receptor [Croceicoccus sp.]|tara:strand:+ start:1890 stop:3737 length:1848 start_codon:yes stop_codon:yes gene_type:complete
MRRIFCLATSALAIASPAAAQDTDQIVMLNERAEPITVTATGLELSVEDTGQPVSIIELPEIQAVQGADLARVLRRLPGVTISRNGPSGSFTGVRVRGAASEQLLVLIDGVKVNDVAAPGGGFDFANILAGSVERIELLRGPNSVIWGSDAMGGVMNLTTRQVDGLSASAEYGAFDTGYATLSGGVVTDRLEAGLTGSYYDTDGFSAASTGDEDDGFRQWQLAGRGRFWLNDSLSLTANGRYADGRLEQDGYPAPFYAFADTDDLQDTEEYSGRIGAEYNGDSLNLRGGYAISDTTRLYTGESYGDFPYETKGGLERAELFGRLDFTESLGVDFGAAREWYEFEDSGSDRSTTLTSGHGQLSWTQSAVTLAAGARYDDHQLFGGEWTFGANGALALGSGLRLRASYGEGFKTPTLYQLYSFYGDVDLSPERSEGYDVGIEKGSRDGPFFAALSLFRRDSTNLIDFDLAENVYYNVGKARAQGVEIELGARPDENLRLGLVYSLLDTEDRTSGGSFEGNDLNRRPDNALTAMIDWASPVGLMLGTDVRLVGDSFDDRGNAVRLDGYVTVDLRASLPIGERLELFGRVENLFDAGYQTVAGYNSGGAAAYGGARVRI